MSRYLILLIAALLLVLSVIFSMPKEHIPTAGYHNASMEWLSIDNPNELDALFPGQTLVIVPRKELSGEFCISEYQPWSSLSIVELLEQCYDLDSRTYGSCDTGSDIRIKDGYIELMNDAEISANYLMNEILGFSEDVFSLCSGTDTKSFERIDYTMSLERGINLFLCIKTKKGFFSIGFIFNDDSIYFKKEQVPKNWRCNSPYNKEVIHADNLMEGINQFAFKSGDKYSTHSIYKTDKPFSIIYNPNQNPRVIYPENETNIYKQHLYNYLILKSEYTEDIDRVWYRCDNSSWNTHNTSQRYVETIINSTLCDGDGLHNIYFRAEANGLIEDEKHFILYKHTDRPDLRNISIFMDASDKNIEIRYLQNQTIINNILCGWYINDIYFGEGKDLYIADLGLNSGDFVEAVCYPTDIFGLTGDPVTSPPLEINLPPSATDISIIPETLYPDSNISIISDYKGLEEEGKSVYRWYVNGELASQESTMSLRETKPGDTITIEYTPVDKGGLSGKTITKTLTLPEEGYYLFSKAVLEYNSSWCYKIGDIAESKRCRDGVELGRVECGDRKNREKLFCIAFLMQDPGYCGYIDMGWYRESCLMLVGGDPEGCLNLTGDERDLCIMEFASSNGDPGICSEIEDPDMNLFCIAIANREPSTCSSITDPALRESCKTESSYK